MMGFCGYWVLFITQYMTKMHHCCLLTVWDTIKSAADPTVHIHFISPYELRIKYPTASSQRPALMILLRIWSSGSRFKHVVLIQPQVQATGSRSEDWFNSIAVSQFYVYITITCFASSDSCFIDMKLWAESLKWTFEGQNLVQNRNH